jgi:multiple sugar transport system ATP-binding protein
MRVVEAMGAEYYAHFDIHAEQVRSGDMRDLVQDAGGVAPTTSDGGTAVVARLSPESQVRSGQPAELWLDASKLHFFDAESGEALTYKR